MSYKVFMKDQTTLVWDTQLMYIGCTVSFLCAMIILSVFGNLDKCIKHISTEFIPQMSKKSCLQSLLAVRDGSGTML